MKSAALLIDASDLELGSSDTEMLDALRGPTWVSLAGRDRSRLRVATTLLHGNEPSGFRAIRRYLRSGRVPATDLLFFFGSVSAAQILPRFSNRTLLSGRDLNRCFRPPYDGAEGRLAATVLARLEDRRPEALIDLHNTSGRGPAYGVLMTRDRACQQVAALWARHVVVTDLRLGALTEATTQHFPSAVVECGGREDPAADSVAWFGLREFADRATLFDRDAAPEVFEHPVRIELRAGCEIAFARQPVERADVTLYPDLDRHNFGMVDVGEPLGWLGPRGLDALMLRRASGTDTVDALLSQRAGALVASRAFRPLMITTHPDIAKSDCLFYAVAKT